MNSSFKQIRQSSLRQNRNASRVVSNNPRGASRLPSASTTHEMSFDASEPTRDGVVELTKNSKYCVSRLPAMPVVLKGTEISSGYTDQNTNHALVVSNDKTFVWDYSSPDHVPNTINFPTSSNTQDPPLAVLVAPAPGSREPGLITINVHTGLVTYWEAVGGAVADGLLHRRKSIQHEVGIYAGEWIDNFQNIEPAGIIATTSSGRYILITLRDSNGKASIHSGTMRGSLGAGLFSAFKGAIMPQGHRRGVVSIKPGPITGRSERQAMIINENGDLSVWECSRSGYSKVLIDEGFKEMMLNRILILYDQAEKTFMVHDVEMNEQAGCIYILSSFLHSEDNYYYVVSTISVKDKEFKLESAHRIQSYTQPSTRPPKLLFPEPRSTLFAVFSHGVVLLEAMPERFQDQSMSRRWEDVITFRESVTIEGAGIEDVSKTNNKITRNCGIVLLANTAGVMRIERFEDEKVSLETRQVALEPDLAKSKIEQAVFYGYDAKLDYNPVDFDHHATDISPRILQQQALTVSNEILTTTSIYMPPILPSLSEHLEIRVACLKRLARFMQDNYPDALSVAAQLQLLQDLQKTVVAKALWDHVDQRLIENATNNVLVTVINKKNREEGDPLRDWFLQKANIIDKLLIDSSDYCKTSRDVECLIDTNNVLLEAIYKNALNVENEYRPIFNLDKNSACEDSPPWTSEPQLIQAFEQQYHITKNAYNALGKDQNASSTLSTQILFIVETLCALYSQRLSWIANCEKASSSREEGERLSSSYIEKRGGWLKQVVSSGNKEGALRIAEEFAIYRSVVEILVEDWKLNNNEEGGADNDDDNEQINMLKNYMGKIGYEFASVVYQYFLETKQLKNLLTLFPEFGDYLDKFFSNKRQAKISWVNDVSKDRFIEAGKTLVESNTTGDYGSNNKLRLSIAKLCILSQGGGNKPMLNEINSQLQVASAQDALAQQLLVSEHSDALSGLTELNALKRVVDRILDRMKQQISINIDELIDALTLIKIDTKEGSLNFYRALKIINESALSQDRKSLNEQLIWQRLLLADSWDKIVNTKSKSDSKVQQVTEKTILYQTLVKVVDEDLMSEKSISYINEPGVLIQRSLNGLSQRYPWAGKKELEQIHNDINSQNQQIEMYINKYGLDSWTKGIYSRVQTVVGAKNAPTLQEMDLS